MKKMKKKTYPNGPKAENVHEANDARRGADPVPRRRVRLQGLGHDVAGVDGAGGRVCGGFSSVGAEGGGKGKGMRAGG